MELELVIPIPFPISPALYSNTLVMPHMQITYLLEHHSTTSFHAIQSKPKKWVFLTPPSLIQKSASIIMHAIMTLP